MPGRSRKLASRLPSRRGCRGLKAGTYTLLPADYALLPGAFRVELDTKSAALLHGTNALLNGSYQVNATTGIANTSIHSVLTTVATITSGAVLRTYSSYDEESYSQYVTAQASLIAVNRPYLPQDAKTLLLNLNPPAQAASVDYPGAYGVHLRRHGAVQPGQRRLWRHAGGVHERRRRGAGDHRRPGDGRWASPAPP